MKYRPSDNLIQHSRGGGAHTFFSIEQVKMIYLLQKCKTYVY